MTHPILFCTPDPPGAIWQDKPQIARRLARNHRVITTGPELHLRGLLSQHQEGHWILADLWRSPLEELEPNLYRFRWSPWVPVTGAPVMGPLTAALRRRRWQTVLRKLAADSSSGNAPILWLFRPEMQSLIDEYGLEPSLVIYHVVDEYSAYPNLSPAQVERQQVLDRQLTARADLVFCTAQSLVEARLPLNRNTHYFPNAVDMRAFRMTLEDPNLSVPEPVSRLPKPLLGIVGGINAKVDLALLAAIAQRRPDWTLGLVGPLSYGLDAAELSQLRALSNVHLIGAVTPEQIPATIAACDVCLIPYRLNEQTRHVNPLKVYEYLAVGKPVVATPLPELGQFPGIVRLADTVNSFEEAVEQALANGADPVAQATRRAIAAANTWDQRVAGMEALVSETLAKKAN